MQQSAGKFLAIPLALFVVFLSLYAIWLILDLPPEEVLLPIVHRFFGRYGVLTALACGLIEALLLVGWYFPGTTIIVAGLILSGADLAQYAAMAGAAAAGLSTGHLINFLVGRHGWYRLLLAFGLKDSLDTAQQWLLTACGCCSTRARTAWRREPRSQQPKQARCVPARPITDNGAGWRRLPRFPA
jgi:membrane protein DedA with SNARE-associated domain